MIHRMKLSSAPFKKIVDGKKIIESRLYDEKRQKISVGDQIEFTCTDKLKKNTIAEVKSLYLYSNFENLFSDFPSTHFGGDSKEDLIEEIETFYSKKDQDKYGVVGIKINLIK